MTVNALGEGSRGVMGADICAMGGGRAGVDAALGAGEVGGLGSFRRSFGCRIPRCDLFRN